MKIDDQIAKEKIQYNINREAASINLFIGQNS